MNASLSCTPGKTWKVWIVPKSKGTWTTQPTLTSNGFYLTIYKDYLCEWMNRTLCSSPLSNGYSLNIFENQFWFMGWDFFLYSEVDLVLLPENESMTNLICVLIYIYTSSTIITTCEQLSPPLPHMEDRRPIYFMLN